MKRYSDVTHPSLKRQKMEEVMNKMFFGIIALLVFSVASAAFADPPGPPCAPGTPMNVACSETIHSLIPQTNPNNALQQRFASATTGMDLDMTEKMSKGNLEIAIREATLETFERGVVALKEGDNSSAVEYFRRCQKFCRIGKIEPPATIDKLNKIATAQLAQENTKRAMGKYREKNFSELYEWLDSAAERDINFLNSLDKKEVAKK